METYVRKIIFFLYLISPLLIASCGNSPSLSQSITNTNTLPVSIDDSYTTMQGDALNVSAPGILGNDIDADNDYLNANIITMPTNGVLVLQSDGAFVYTPNDNFLGFDSFTYQANDETTNSATSTVTINVTAQTTTTNTAPVSLDDSYTIMQGDTLNVSAPGILGNDIDADNDYLNANIITMPTNGVLVLQSDGAFVYTPNDNFLGFDSFTYQANDETTNSATSTVTINVTAQTATTWDASNFNTVYDVGDGEAYLSPGEIPWESLSAGTLVRIHWRSTPYRDKWAIRAAGTQTEPIVVLGVPNTDGSLPIIEGNNAITRTQLSSFYYNENRSIIKIDNPNSSAASHIYIENLEIRGAHPNNSFIDDTGNTVNYSSNAASIHISAANDVTIRKCILHDSGNGIFSGYLSSNVNIISNYIYGNGISGSSGGHNSYTESLGIIFEYNRYGPLRTGANGNNIKDRSAGTIIRYNWIESGSRQIDLVEPENHPSLYNDPNYHTTYVYGNIIIEPANSTNGNIVHYGGDSGITTTYRKGTLYLYNNTIVSLRTDETRLLGLSSNDETADVRNNIIYTINGSNLAIASGKGMIWLQNNWLPSGWRYLSDTSDIGVITNNGNTEGISPGFEDISLENFSLINTSTAINAAGELHSATILHPVNHEYAKHRDSNIRHNDGNLDIGAFEKN